MGLGAVQLIVSIVDGIGIAIIVWGVFINAVEFVH